MRDRSRDQLSLVNRQILRDNSIPGRIGYRPILHHAIRFFGIGVHMRKGDRIVTDLQVCQFYRRIAVTVADGLIDVLRLHLRIHSLFVTNLFSSRYVNLDAYLPAWFKAW